MKITNMSPGLRVVQTEDGPFALLPKRTEEVEKVVKSPAFDGMVASGELKVDDTKAEQEAAKAPEAAATVTVQQGNADPKKPLATQPARERQ